MMTNRWLSALTGTGRAIAETYRLGFRTFVAAPVIVAIAIVPEFVQHVVEIRLDMFMSLTRFRAFADDPSRWAFGYAKLAGFLIALLLTARFWGRGASLRRTFTFDPRMFAKLILAIAAALAVSEALAWPGRHGAPAAIAWACAIVSAVVQSGLSVLIVGFLVEDERLTLRSAIDRLPTAALMLVTLAAGFGPMQLLHMLDHRFAIGKSDGIVWAVMTWDALIVGLMATLTGSALWAAYRTSATWRGWGERKPQPA